MSTRVGREVARHRGGETPAGLATTEVKADWEKVYLDKDTGDKESGSRDTTVGLVSQVLPRHRESS